MAAGYPTTGSNGQSRSARNSGEPQRLFVVAKDLFPKVPTQVEHTEASRRRSKARPNYWSGIDWRERIKTDAPSCASTAFRVENQGTDDACAGFAVWHALRANVAIHRKQVVNVNPYVIWGLAREADPRWQYGRADLLHSALQAVNNFGIPELPGFTYADAAAGGVTASIESRALDFQGQDQRKEASIRKIQGIVDMPTYLGEVSSWLHAFGPVAVHMMVERASFDNLQGQNATVNFNDCGAYEGELSTRLVGHDVVVVGYVPDNEDGDPRADSFIIMNSYGDGWGDKGFAYVKVDTARLCFRSCFGLLLREHLGYEWGGRPGKQIGSLLAEGSQSAR